MTSNGKPLRLPPELLEQVVHHLGPPCANGDPTAARTLAACSLVSRQMRAWSLRARYGVIVCPRHVREFRKWIKRSQDEMTGYTFALFVALDDVSKLTSMSAGWDVELLHVLQQQGPHLVQLSLWTSETRALLRDPAQIRGPRMRSVVHSSSTTKGNAASSPAAEETVTIESIMKANAKRRRAVTRMVRKLRRQGRFVLNGDDYRSFASVPLKADFARRANNEAQTQAETAAAKERARQTLPRWLRDELADTDSRKEIQRRYKAHLATDAREYQHEHQAAHEERQRMSKEEREAAMDALTLVQQATLEGLRQQGRHDEYVDGSSSSDESDDEIDELTHWSCMPVKLSICPSLPLHEHEEPLNFARMTVWTRVQELDVFVAVPAEVPRCLMLFASLVASPLIRFRFSSIYASLLICLSPSAAAEQDKALRQPKINIAAGLQAVMHSETLRSLLFDEFHNHHSTEIRLLESAMQAVITSCRSAELTTATINKRARGLGSTLSSLTSTPDASKQVIVRVLQGNQGHFGKLKDRRQDFLARALGTGTDYWTQNELLS